MDNNNVSNIAVNPRFNKVPVTGNRLRFKRNFFRIENDMLPSQCGGGRTILRVKREFVLSDFVITRVCCTFTPCVANKTGIHDMELPTCKDAKKA